MNDAHPAPGARTLNRDGLAEALGVDASQISRWAAAGMPCDGSARRRRYDAAECAAWRAAHVHERAALKARTSTAPTSTSRPSTAREQSAHEAALLNVLSDVNAPPPAKARAAYDLAAFRLGQAYRDDLLGGKTFDDLKHASEELRRAEQDYIDLAKARGELIDRAVAKEVIGEMARALVDLHENFETDVARQACAWVEDPAFLAAGTDERRRIARTWLRERSAQVRRAWADEIDRKAAESAT